MSTAFFFSVPSSTANPIPTLASANATPALTPNTSSAISSNTASNTNTNTVSTPAGSASPTATAASVIQSQLSMPMQFFHPGSGMFAIANAGQNGFPIYATTATATATATPTAGSVTGSGSVSPAAASSSFNTFYTPSNPFLQPQFTAAAALFHPEQLQYQQLQYQQHPTVFNKSKSNKSKSQKKVAGKSKSTASASSASAAAVAVAAAIAASQAQTQAQAQAQAQSQSNNGLINPNTTASSSRSVSPVLGISVSGPSTVATALSLSIPLSVPALINGSNNNVIPAVSINNSKKRKSISDSDSDSNTSAALRSTMPKLTIPATAVTSHKSLSTTTAATATTIAAQSRTNTFTPCPYPTLRANSRVPLSDTIHGYSSHPVHLLTGLAERQFTIKRDKTTPLSLESRETLVRVNVRLMGEFKLDSIYFVAKDVCPLVSLRKGSVAKTIHDFIPNIERTRMPVHVNRSNGSGCIQMLTVLTIAGVLRMRENCRKPAGKSTVDLMLAEVERLCGVGPTINGIDRAGLMEAAENARIANLTAIAADEDDEADGDVAVDSNTAVGDNSLKKSSSKLLPGLGPISISANTNSATIGAAAAASVIHSGSPKSATDFSPQYTPKTRPRFSAKVTTVTGAAAAANAGTDQLNSLMLLGLAADQASADNSEGTDSNEEESINPSNPQYIAAALAPVPATTPVIVSTILNAAAIAQSF